MVLTSEKDLDALPNSIDFLTRFPLKNNSFVEKNEIFTDSEYSELISGIRKRQKEKRSFLIIFANFDFNDKIQIIPFIL